jgi:hypothetical protein
LNGRGLTILLTDLGSVQQGFQRADQQEEEFQNSAKEEVRWHEQFPQKEGQRQTEITKYLPGAMYRTKLSLF